MRDLVPITTYIGQENDNILHGDISGATHKTVAVGLIKVGEKNLYMVV
jgi:hypothetical protein